MSSLKIRILELVTAINLVLGFSLGSLLYIIWPEHYFPWYPSIPLFYWITGCAMALFLDRAAKKHKGHITTIYMLVRMCKFIVALIFLWLYASLVRSHLKAFGFTLMLFYFIYVGLETYSLYVFEKKKTKRLKKEKDEQNKK